MRRVIEFMDNVSPENQEQRVRRAIDILRTTVNYMYIKSKRFKSAACDSNKRSERGMQAGKRTHHALILIPQPTQTATKGHKKVDLQLSPARLCHHRSYVNQVPNLFRWRRGGGTCEISIVR